MEKGGAEDMRREGGDTCGGSMWKFYVGGHVLLSERNMGTAT